MSDRVVVTGLGVVSPLGNGVERYWRALLEDESRPSPYAAIDARTMPHRHVYSVLEPPPHRAGDAGGRACGFAVAAARMALEDAGLGAVPLAATVMGNSMGDDLHEAARTDGRPVEGLDAYFFQAAAAVAAGLDLRGPVVNVSTACSAGLYSVGVAADMIRAGRVDVVLAGGTEALSRVAWGCFNRLAAADPVACRPFDMGRKGTIMGEGAAVLVLESERHFRARGWPHAWALVEGSGWSCDGHHITIPEPSGRHALEAARRALADAGVDAGAIGCLLAHGTGTEQNDVVEAKLVEDLFGARAAEVWVCGIKGKLGHAGGAAGAFQALTAALVLERRLLPPTGNVEQIDPRCRGIRLATGRPVPLDVDHVLMSSYAFGGNNVSVVLGRCHG